MASTSRLIAWGTAVIAGCVTGITFPVAAAVTGASAAQAGPAVRTGDNDRELSDQHLGDSGVVGEFVNAPSRPRVGAATPAPTPTSSPTPKPTPTPTGPAPVPVTIFPSPQTAVPNVVDAQPAYRGQNSCDPIDKPGATALGALMIATYKKGYFGVSRYCTEGTTEHSEGRAVDWMLNAANPAEKAVADQALGWLTANNGAHARRLGVMYLIFNRAMWRAYAPERGWAPYSGDSPHTDHIHFSLTWDGAYKRTSWWTGQATASEDRGPCRIYTGEYAPIHNGSANYAGCAPLVAPPSTYFSTRVWSQKGEDIAMAQSKLGITADGVFGRGTWNALLAWQAAQGLPRTGVLDKATWSRLLPGAYPPGMTPKPTPTPTPAPSPNPNPNPAPNPTPSAQPVPRPPAPITPQQPALRKVPTTVRTRFTPYSKTVLKVGSRGTAVTVLQRTLGLKADGVFGSQTRAALVARQKLWKLAATGVTSPAWWATAEVKTFPWVSHRKTALKVGSRGKAVSALQAAVKVKPDGVYGRSTAIAVARIQALYRLPTSGAVNPTTWLAVIDISST